MTGYSITITASGDVRLDMAPDACLILVEEGPDPKLWQALKTMAQQAMLRQGQRP